MACIAKRRNRYVIDFYDDKGKRRWKTLPKGTTKTKAKEILREIEDQLSKGIYLPDKQIPSFAKVADDWLEYKKTNLRETTWDVYKGHVKNHLHCFHHMLINRVTTPGVEKFITSKQKDGVNINTLRKSLIILNQIMNYAVRHKYLDYNPVREAEKPRSRVNEDDEHTINILSPGQINQFLANVTNRKYRTLFLLAVFSGARQGELLGLKWSDADWINNQIHIQRTYNNGRFFATKTKSSKRKIDIGPTVMTELKKWKLARPQNDLDLVFPNKAGNPINHQNMVNRYFNPALIAAGIPLIRFHDLRHTYASIMIEQGENIKYIQSQLGHSSPTVTLNVYAHLMKPTNQEAACRLEDTIFNHSGSKTVAKTKKGINR